MMVPDDHPYATRVLGSALNHRLHVREAVTLSHVGYGKQVDLGQIEVLATLRAKPITVKSQVLIDVRRESPTHADDGTWKELLKRHTRGQPVEIGGLV